MPPPATRTRGLRLATALLCLTCTLAITSHPATASPDRAPATPATPASRPLTTDQALAQAQRTGVAVAVPGATTATDTVQANPDGTLTLNRSMFPVRAMVAGAWKPLDATLKTNSDGTISTTTTTTGLRLSGGGGMTLATMTSAGRTLTLSLPMTLPAPTLDGATATYPDLMTGVDLQVTATAQGGFSEVLIVKTPAAAANPQLSSLTISTQTNGLSLSADTTGALTAASHGQPVFTAPPPIMWDSTAPPAGAATPNTASGTGTPVDPQTGQPLESTAAGPGKAARTAPIAVTANAGTITLTPDPTLLTGDATTYPVYIDPTWSSVSGAKNGWSTVSEYHGATNYWDKTPDPAGEMQVGNSGTMWSHTLINFPISAKLAGATINSATLTITENWSYSCTPSQLNVFAPATTLTSSNATWNFWASASIGALVDHQTVAHGHDSGCPAAGVGFDVRTGIQAAVAAHRATQTFLLTGVNEASDHESWKEFVTSSPNLTITYNHPPATPTGMTTSPATACTAATPTTVGDGAVSLYTPVSDPDGGSLNVTYSLWKTSDTTMTQLWPPNTTPLTYSAGTTAVAVVPENTLKASAGTTITEFSWHTKVSDGIATTSWSAACNFNFDPTRTGPPGISPNGGTIGQIGQHTATFVLSHPTTGTLPTSYLYQLNGAAPQTVTADSTGNAQITITPARFTNTLTVTSRSAGGNIGDTVAVTFNAALSAIQTDADLTGDNIPDLLTIGGHDAIPAGLWQAQGQAGTGHTTGTGQIIPTALDIGAHGNGIQADQAPTDFTAAHAITGHFTGTNLQDILVYYTSGDQNGTALVLNGNGDGSPLNPQNSATQTLILQDTQGNSPQQIVNAGNTSGDNLAYPDLITISGDDTDGFALNYYPSQDGFNDYDSPTQLTTQTPTGGADWNTWTITTCQLPTGTAMYLRNTTTGSLYLWTGLSYDPTTQTLTIGNQYTVSSTFSTTQPLQAADINGDGLADLWTINPSGAATAWLLANPTTNAATITAQPVQTLQTATHTWALNDPAATDGGAVTTITDTTAATPLPATGTGGTTWTNTDALFHPDIAFNGTSGALSTTGPALATNGSFTVSAWVKPTTGGTIVSQDGTTGAGFVLSLDTTTNFWTFGMPAADTADTAGSYARSGGEPIKTGIWTHITGTYNAPTQNLALYLDGVEAAGSARTTTWNATHNLQIGDQLVAGKHTNFFNGQIANVEIWNQALTPVQVADLSATPGYVMFESDNTDYINGQTWTVTAATMTFNAGQLTIHDTRNSTTTTTFGATGHPTAVLTLQPDGNLVIYPQPQHTAGTALWSPNTYPHPGDAAFFQPDGNLVIYDVDGRVLWQSATYN